MIGKLIRFMIALLLAIGLLPVGEADVTAEEITEYPASGESSAQAPEGYMPLTPMDGTEIPSQSNISVNSAEGIDDVRVLLIQDALPWNSYANTQILDGLGVAYDKTTTVNFVNNVKLENYDVVIFANDQAFSAYDNYAQFSEYLELYANLGGVIIFGACDAGWADGTITTNLPGNVVKGHHYAPNNRIVSPGHPIISGVLTDGNPITDESLSGHNYCSHTYFESDTLPPGTAIIIEDTDYNEPTLVEYPLGNGRVIASGLTWEYHIDHKTNTFAQIGMDDMFLYAIRVSNGTVKDFSKLTEYRLNKQAHHVIVADAETTQPIKGATVTVDVNNQSIKKETDENGDVSITEYGKATVTVSADGYQIRKLIYTAEKQKARMFFLPKEESPKLPYVTMMEETDKEYDYLTSRYYYRENIDTSVRIQMDAEWYGKKASKYKLYQTDAQGKEIAKVESTDGRFTFQPGKTFKPGYDVKVRIFATDGTASRAAITGIVIQKETAMNAGADGVTAGNIEDITGFQLFESKKVNVSDSTLSKLIRSSWEVEGELFPVDVVKISNKEDGSYTFRVSIGLGDFEHENLLDKRYTADWQNFKDYFKEAKKSIKDRKKVFDKLKKKYESGLKRKKLKSQLSVELELLGYLELQYNAFGQLVKSSGGLIGKGETKGSWGKTISIPAIPVPLYFELELSAAVDIEGGVKATFVDGQAYLGTEGLVELTLPEFLVGGGVGVYGVAQAGIAGDAALKMQIAPEFKGELESQFLARAKVLFLGEFNYKIGGGTTKLWGPDGNNAVAEPMGELVTVGEPVITYAPNDYKELTSDWYGSNEILQDYILPDTIPQLVEVNGNKILFFQSNIGTETDLIKVMYSVNDGAGWSEPLPVCDDDTYDLFYEAYEDNGTVHVVWEKATAPVTADTAEGAIQELLQNSEIYYAQFNPETGVFSEAVNLTNNATVDMIPAIAAENGAVSAYWVNSDSTDVMKEDGAYTIRKAVYDGTAWSAPEDVIAVNGYIYDIAAGYVNGNAVVSYNDRGSLYTVENGSAVRISKEGAAADGLTYDNNRFLFAEDGVLYAYTPGAERSAWNVSELAVASNYHYLETENRSAVVWMENGETESVIHASVWTDNGFSEPIDIYTTDAYKISSYDVTADADGTWHVAADVVDRNDETRSALLYTDIAPKHDLEMEYAYVDESEREGDAQPVTVSVVNSGESMINEVYVRVSGDGFNHEETLSCAIQPGAEEAFELNLDVTDVTGTKDLEVYADAYNEDTYDNNYDSITIGLVDTSVELEYFYNASGEVVIGAHVNNQSKVPAHTTISILEDNEEGVVLDMKNLGEIRSDEEVLYMYSFDPNEINFGEADSKNYVFRVDTNEDDYNTENNYEYAIIYRNEETLSLSEEDMVIVYGETASLTADREDELVWTSSDESVVSVDADGKIKGVSPGVATVSARTLGGVRADCEVTVLFKDVANPDQYFFEPVYWAFFNGITVGAGGAGKFSPAASCTREQFVTFLWRLYGEPEPESESEFTDVAPAAWYYKPIAWAAENGITTGLNDGTGRFGVGQPCTREQCVTFLHRSAGTPEVYDYQSFSDVASDRYYYEAISWAAENGITVGLNDGTGRFGVGQKCTRGMLVTFLHRFAVN
ncbi:MAG: S-layer homology domain-containing protein [Erysipelotrichaceae bacterium]|nr:S-layer homology domain-containing protein [Erysipelotrichaceae bacterium]